LGEGPVLQAAGRNEAIRAELERMLEDDQTLRSQADEVEKKYGSKSKELEELWARQTVNDKKNLSRLEEMIKENGWPGLSSVGGKASLAAFLILQHADYEHQKKYFQLVKEALRTPQEETAAIRDGNP
jgi:hypothetical protein